jgi:ribosomal protein L11
MNIKNKKIDLIKIIYIQSQSAEAAPPLGTILGNIGVNTIKFCEEFNKFSKILPIYLKLKVKINIHENKTFNFFIINFSLSYCFNLLKFKQILIKGKEKKEFMCIYLKDVIILSIYKFPQKNITESFIIIFGLIKSMKLKIIKNYVKIF